MNQAATPHSHSEYVRFLCFWLFCYHLVSDWHMRKKFKHIIMGTRKEKHLWETLQSTRTSACLGINLPVHNLQFSNLPVKLSSYLCFVVFLCFSFLSIFFFIECVRNPNLCSQEHGT